MSRLWRTGVTDWHTYESSAVFCLGRIRMNTLDRIWGNSLLQTWAQVGKIFLNLFSSGGEDGAGVRRRRERPDWVWRVPRADGQEGEILCFAVLCFRSLSLFFVLCSSCSWPRRWDLLFLVSLFLFFVLALCSSRSCPRRWDLVLCRSLIDLQVLRCPCMCVR